MYICRYISVQTERDVTDSAPQSPSLRRVVALIIIMQLSFPLASAHLFVAEGYVVRLPLLLATFAIAVISGDISILNGSIYFACQVKCKKCYRFGMIQWHLMVIRQKRWPIIESDTCKMLNVH